MSMRPLVLHSSALNDVEYDNYTSSLKDLAVLDDKPTSNDIVYDDSYYDNLSVSVREARAWLRGRYSTLDPHLIDSVCHFRLRLSPSFDPHCFLSSDPPPFQPISRSI